MATSVNKVIVRAATKRDAHGIHQLSRRCYESAGPYPLDVIRAQITNFPEGQFVAEIDGQIRGYVSSILLDEKRALRKHSWSTLTGGGYGSTHDPDGDCLYGVEVMVDTEARGLRVGQRLYDARKKLCLKYNLKSIVFAGRMPLLSKKIKTAGTPEEYIELVQAKKIRDPVISFQLRNGFEIIRVIKNYIPSDAESLGYGLQMRWINNSYADDSNKEDSALAPVTNERVRVSTVQFAQRGIESYEEFERIVTYFVDVVADYKSDFVLFPELFTLQLLSINNEEIPPNEAIETLTAYTDRLKQTFHDLAIKYNVNIIAGSHPTRVEDDQILNIAYVFLRDGSVYEQPKIHPTPNERYWWNIDGGDKLSVIDTDCGPIGVLICYDSEFPELSRHLVDQGAQILFVPFCTDERQSYLRVRYACQARAVENQIYVVMSGNVGNLPRVQNMDIQYAQSCILTPCDLGFARDGIAADTTPNVETVAFADLRLSDLEHARIRGTVQNLKDRRLDLYQVSWLGD